MEFKFGDKVTSDRWLDNEEHLVLDEGRMGGVTVVNSGGEVQIVHNTFLTMIEEPVITYAEKLSKTEDEFRIKLNNLEDSVDALLASFPKRIEKETESVDKYWL